MKTLLIFSKNPGFPAAVRAAVEAARFRIVPQADLGEMEPLLLQRNVDACLIDSDLTDIRPIRLIQQIRHALPKCPILVYTGSRQWEWEEEAYLLGVNHILTKPLRARLLNVLLTRCLEEADQESSASPPPRVESPAVNGIPTSSVPVQEQRPIRTLEVLREFSGILTFSLCPQSLLKQFLLLLREIIGINRAVIFLRHAPGTLRKDQLVLGQERRLRSACALGLSSSLLEHFELSLDAGIGGALYRSGRILKNSGDDAWRNREVQKEFELLGGQVAIPILDRESLIGVAVFDGRVTGEVYTNEELALMFHLLEELGMAIKNSWLHDQLSANHEMMADVLNQMGSGCIVVGRDLTVLHANQSALQIFSPPESTPAELEFSDLPQALGSKVFEVLNNGVSLPEFQYNLPGTEKVYRVLVTPFRRQNSVTANSVLLVIEDFTYQERNRQLELEASRLRLVKSMAEHLAHEIGNALVPISTSQQLMSEKLGEAEGFKDSLHESMTQGIRRISRLSNQMYYLAQGSNRRQEPVAMEKVLTEAFEEAQLHQPRKQVNLKMDTGKSGSVYGDREALKHAFMELFINAIQALPNESPVIVHMSHCKEEPATEWLKLEIIDPGSGFSPETARNATEPFYSTRNVGLGLGLTVTRRVVERHRGRLQIMAAGKTRNGLVTVYLPLAVEEEAGPTENSFKPQNRVSDDPQ